MNAPYPTIPWHTPALWLEANATLGFLLERHTPELEAPRQLAHQMRTQLTSLFPIMDGLCHTTCPACSEVCCQHASVWIDFKDLLFFHLAAIPVPDSQLLSRRGERCRYATTDGCRLDRLQRPFVCTWYLCPAQSQCLREQHDRWHTTQTCLQQIKHFRHRMEMSFIQATHPSAMVIQSRRIDPLVFQSTFGVSRRSPSMQRRIPPLPSR